MNAVLSRLRGTSSRGGKCSHARKVDLAEFKRIVWDKFALDRTQSGLQLRCETCGTSEDLWICLTCCRVYCISKDGADHALAHQKVCKGSHLLLNCRDSHILCCSCEQYLYPREVAGSSELEQTLTPAVEAWLQVLGRSRNWWRELDCNADMGCHGLKNFGNTCFFTSTLQALLHNRPLGEALRCFPGAQNSERKVSEVQKELLLLTRKYWTDTEAQRVVAAIDPRGLWNAVASNAVFGEYVETTMEDANTLLLDLLDALDEPMVHSTFGVAVSSQTFCSVCAERRRGKQHLLGRFFPTLPVRVCDTVVEFVVGAPFTSSCTEVVISLPLVREEGEGNSKPSSPSKSNLSGWARLASTIEEAETELAELLGVYLAPERISDFRCEHCRTLGKVMKRSSLRSTSDNLVFNLKRFAPAGTGMRIKVHRRVKVPLVLDLGALLGAAHLGVYELGAMVVHDGGMGGGHYMAYARRRNGLTFTEDWIWFSDQHFGVVDPTEVFDSEPFLLFYERKKE